jgi:hypothetical protein
MRWTDFHFEEQYYLKVVAIRKSLVPILTETPEIKQFKMAVTDEVGCYKLITMS